MRFPIEPDGPKRLELSWRLPWRKMKVIFDETEVGLIPGEKELKEGREFQVSDGSVIQVKLTSWPTSQLVVKRNGEPIGGSPTEEESGVASAYGVVFFVAGITLLFGIIGLFTDMGGVVAGDSPWASIGVGLILLFLGAMIKRGSIVALVATIGLVAVDTALLVYMTVTGEIQFSGALVMRAFILYMLIKGVDPLRAAKSLERENPSVPVV